MGNDNPSAIIAFLDLMQECERAGAKALRSFEQMAPPNIVAQALPRLSGDEARYCAGLSRQICRLGGQLRFGNLKAMPC